MTDIYMEANEVWEYFQKYKGYVEEVPELIAERDDFGVEIYLSAEDDMPLIEVLMDGLPTETQVCVSAYDCKKTVEDLYEDYLTVKAVDGFIDEKTDDDLMAEREAEIDDAISAMCDVVVQNVFDVVDDEAVFYEKLKDHICEWLYTECGISVYRPMYLECDDGTEEFCKFPYDEMEI